MEANRKIVLQDGKTFFGKGFGSTDDRVFDLVFNTSMCGYQEILTDPAYMGLGVLMTYPVLGNYGITDEDGESKNVWAQALILRDINETPSNFRAVESLSDFMDESRTPGITGVDTRALTLYLRGKTPQRALLTGIETETEKAVEIINSCKREENPVARVSCAKKWYSRISNPVCGVAVVDCGVKLSQIRRLRASGCNVTVVPYDTDASTLLSLKPDGVIISGGPGDPKKAQTVSALIKDIRGKAPLLGLGLGFYLICEAFGVETSQSGIAHFGSNYPVRRLSDGKIDITTQNSAYSTELESFSGSELTPEYINIIDNTVAGASCKAENICGVAFEPRAFSVQDDFLSRVNEFCNNGGNN